MYSYNSPYFTDSFTHSLYYLNTDEDMFNFIMFSYYYNYIKIYSSSWYTLIVIEAI